MLKPINIIVIAIFFIFLLFSLSFSQESMTITTYYPSPYGSYNELTAYKMKIGDTYSGSGTTVNTDDLLVEGNVGIGTASPGIYRLNVQGDAYVNGRIASLDLNTMVIDNATYTTAPNEICVKAFDPLVGSGTEKCSYGTTCTTTASMRYICLKTGP